MIHLTKNEKQNVKCRILEGDNKLYQILLRDTERPYIIHKIKKTNKLKVTNYKERRKLSAQRRFQNTQAAM